MEANYCVLCQEGHKMSDSCVEDVLCRMGHYVQFCTVVSWKHNFHQKFKSLDGKFPFEIVVIVATDTILAKNRRNVPVKINRLAKKGNSK